MKKIERLVKGSNSPSFIQADFGNQLIDVANCFLNGTVSPTSAGRIEYGKGNWVLKLNLKGASFATSAHPFQVTVKQDGDDWVLTLEPDSRIYKNPELDAVTITGLGDSFTVASGYKVWIECTVSSGIITAAEIKVGADGWDNYPEPGEYSETDPNPQTKCFKLIAIISADGDTLFANQLVRNHLIAKAMCNSGEALIWLNPYG
jgi:hypothetical protein